MDEHKGKANDAFAHAAHGHEVEAVTAPDMIKDSAPHPEPAPHGAETVKRQLFNQRWDQEVEKHRPDPFDQVDQTKQQRLSQNFGEQSQGQSRGSDRGRE